MREHPTAQELEQYRERVLSPERFLVVHSHVNSCAECYDKCREPRQLKRDYETFVSALTPALDDAPYHLSGEEARGYVENRLGEIDLEIAESHLELCATCREDVRLLSEKGGQRGPVAGVHTAGRGRFGQAGRSRAWPVSAPPVWVVAAAVVAACVVGLSLFLLLKVKSPDQPILPARADNTDGNHAPPFATLPPPDSRGTQTPPPAAGARQSSQSPGEEVKSAPGGALKGATTRVTLVLNDAGRNVSVSARGRLTGLEMLPGWVQQEVRKALLTRTLERPPSLAELDGEPGTLLSEPDDALTFRLSSPVGRVIRSARPTFRWQPLAGAASYTVTVVDAGLNEVVSSGPLKGSEWTTPKSLKEGAIYSWQVTALKDGKTITSPAMPAPQAKFRILSRTLKEELRRAEEGYGGSHLALGILYVRAGLLDEAETEFSALLRDNPRSNVADKLLRDVRTLKRGHRDRRVRSSSRDISARGRMRSMNTGSVNERSYRAYRSSPIRMNPAQYEG